MTICFFWINTHYSLYLFHTHMQTPSCWINDLMSNEPVLSVCYQCDPRQILWNHQHLRWGAAWCNDRRSRNRHLQRVSVHVPFLNERCINTSYSYNSKPSSHSFHEWMKFVILTKLMHDEWRQLKYLFWKYLKQRNCRGAAEAWIYRKTNLSKNVFKCMI